MQFDEFLGILELLKNSSKYEAKVEELKQRQEAIQESITTLGVVGDIAKAKTQAESLVTKGKELVTKAEAQAASLLAGAQVAYEDKHKALQAREVLAGEALAKYKTITEQFAFRDSALRVVEKQAEALRKQLDIQSSELSVKQKELDERLAKLRQVMG